MTLAGLEARLKSRRGWYALWASGTGLAALVALLMWFGGVPGWDAAAHLYKAYLVREGHGVVWDSFWYGGGYGAVTYGFVFYFVAQVVPAWLLTVAACGLVAPFYLTYQRHQWHADDPWPAWALAGVMAVYQCHGQDPFVLALALTLGGMALLARGHPLWAAAPIAVGIFTNPLALVVGASFLVADLVARPPTRRPLLLLAGALAPFVVLRLLLGAAFSEPTWYVDELVQTVLFVSFALAGTALAGLSRVHPPRPSVVFFLLYALLCVVSAVVPGSPLGNNVGRLFMVFAVPLLLFFRNDRLRRPFGVAWLPAALIPIALFGVLQMATVFDHFTDRADLSATRPSFFEPALDAAARYADADHRLHVVALRRHYEALYLPEAGYPITRGWFRQADAIHNRLFYRAYDAAGYAAWLRRMGVEYVLCPDAALDPWSEREPRLLASSPDFAVVERTGAWTVYRLRAAAGLLEPLDGGEGRVLRMGHRAAQLEVERPGRYLLKVSWSPYWRLRDPQGDAWASGQGISASRDRFLVLDLPRAGDWRVEMAPDAGTVLRQLF